jgi:hypothetical protein
VHFSSPAVSVLPQDRAPMDVPLVIALVNEESNVFQSGFGDRS